MSRTLYAEISASYHQNPALQIDGVSVSAAFDSAAYPLAHLILMMDAVAARGPDQFTRFVAREASLCLQMTAESVERAADHLRGIEADANPSVARDVILTGASGGERAAA